MAVGEGEVDGLGEGLGAADGTGDDVGVGVGVGDRLELALGLGLGAAVGVGGDVGPSDGCGLALGAGLTPRVGLGAGVASAKFESLPLESPPHATRTVASIKVINCETSCRVGWNVSPARIPLQAINFIVWSPSRPSRPLDPNGFLFPLMFY